MEAIKTAPHGFSCNLDIFLPEIGIIYIYICMYFVCGGGGGRKGFNGFLAEGFVQRAVSWTTTRYWNNFIYTDKYR